MTALQKKEGIHKGEVESIGVRINSNFHEWVALAVFWSRINGWLVGLGKIDVSKGGWGSIAINVPRLVTPDEIRALQTHSSPQPSCMMYIHSGPAKPSRL